MSQPRVTIPELDGALGTLPASAGRPLAIIGASSKGPVGTPAPYARVRDLVGDFGVGPMVEGAANAIAKFGGSVLVCRTGASTAGSFPAADAVAFAGLGTSTVTVDDENTAPADDLEFYLEVTRGGTVGTDGIEFKWSLDGGRTLSPVTSLGTQMAFVFPESGGAAIDFGAGTLVAGDRLTFLGKAPKWNTTEVVTALNALFASAVNWEIAFVTGDIEPGDMDVIDPVFVAGRERGKLKSWVGGVRMPTPGESEADYLTAMSAAFGTKATLHGELCAAAARISSGVSGRRHRRSPAYIVAPKQASVAEHINIAAIRGNLLPGVSLRDALGNPEEHDETLNAGLDDARFTVLRTWEGRGGIYVNRSRIFAPAGSDYRLHTYRRVANLAQATLRPYLEERLSVPLLVDADSGFILESEAQDIEAGARAILRAALTTTPKASGVQVRVGRTDNLLAENADLTGEVRVIPLAYPEGISFDFGFLNPALQVQTA